MSHTFFWWESHETEFIWIPLYAGHKLIAVLETQRMSVCEVANVMYHKY